MAPFLLPGSRGGIRHRPLFDANWHVAKKVLHKNTRSMTSRDQILVRWRWNKPRDRP
jgi:hypothetical protein